MIKDVLIPITNTPGDANALVAAIALATHETAHLVVLEFLNLPLPAPAGPWGDGELDFEEIDRKCRAEAESKAVAWRERLSGAPISSEVRVIESFFSDSAGMAALHARFSDVAMMTMASDGAGDASTIHDYFNSLLLGTGRPVLLVPPDHLWRPAKHAVIAWRPTREATRAVHDAMPLLRDAESVDVLKVCRAGGEQAENPAQGADIVAHLARHGLNVRAVAHQLNGESVALALIRHAHDTGADLLVAGGYGHSRFREWVLGGVTRDLLSGACQVPILFSH